MSAVQPDQSADLSPLYEQDETAWLDLSARLIEEGRRDELDYDNLREFLESMARRDRREVESRMAVLMAHLLKWTHQAAKRSRSWLGTLEVQRHELGLLLESGTLRNHAELEIGSAYQAAVRQAAAETGLKTDAFPQDCPYTVAELLEMDLPLAAKKGRRKKGS